MEQTNPEEVKLDDLVTINELAKQFPNILTVQTLRWHLRHRHQNGLDKCCVRLGKKLLLVKSRIEKEWIPGLIKSRAA